MKQDIAKVIAKAVNATIKDMPFSKVREMVTSPYMDIRIKMQNDSNSKGEA